MTSASGSALPVGPLFRVAGALFGIGQGVFVAYSSLLIVPLVELLRWAFGWPQATPSAHGKLVATGQRKFTHGPKSFRLDLTRDSLPMESLFNDVTATPDKNPHVVRHGEGSSPINTPSTLSTATPKAPVANSRAMASQAQPKKAPKPMEFASPKIMPDPAGSPPSVAVAPGKQGGGRRGLGQRLRDRLGALGRRGKGQN